MKHTWNLKEIFLNFHENASLNFLNTLETSKLPLNNPGETLSLEHPCWHRCNTHDTSCHKWFECSKLKKHTKKHTCLVQGGKKYFALWESHPLSQYFTQDSVIHTLAEALYILHLHFTRKQLLPEKIVFNQRRIFQAKRN